MKLYTKGIMSFMTQAHDDPLSIFSFNFQDIDPKLSTGEIETSLPNWIGKIALILVIRYEGKISGIGVERYFFGYKGLSSAHQLSEKEYEEIESKLPNDFRRDFV